MRMIGKLPAMAAAIFAVAVAACLYAGEGDKGRKNQKTDKEVHVLESLWKEYSRADEADLPQKAEQILDRIIREAKSEGYAWDFYDAERKWYGIVVSRDWKRREEARDRVRDDAQEFGNPVVAYNLAVKSGIIRTDIDMKWYEENVVSGRKDLLNSMNRAFYSADNALSGAGVPESIVAGISNDYEYLLWSLSVSPGYYSRSIDTVRVIARRDLSEYLAGSYPSSAYLEFRNVADTLGNIKEYQDRVTLLESFVEKYSGKAISLLARQEILRQRKTDLDGRLGISGRKPVSDDYRQLRADCVEFEKMRKGFSGKEKEIAEYCNGAAGLIDIMDAGFIRTYLDDLTLSLALRNIAKVEVELRRDSLKGPLVYSSVLENQQRSYYLLDTLKCTFPANLADGKYFIACKAGEYGCVEELEKHSVSLAYRSDANGKAVYIADYRSGRPIDKADLSFSVKGNVVKVVRDFAFSGFTPVQHIIDSLGKVYGKDRIMICAECNGEDGMKKESRDVYLSANSSSAPAGTIESGTIFKDRSAFNPGDTVCFKAVLYSSMKGSGKYRVVPSGKQVEAVLVGADGKKISSLMLETGEYGSVAGEFEIPEGLMNGMFRISILDEERACASTSFVVDEFVLPTYMLEFEKDTSLYFNGDTVHVKGRLKSYSGHSVSSLDVSYVIRYPYGDVMASGKVMTSADGKFDIGFASLPEGQSGSSYFITVRSVDLTGETSEWSTSRRVEPAVYFDLSWSGDWESNGSVWINGKRESCIVPYSDSIDFKCRLHTDYGQTVPGTIEYRLMRNGDEMLAGTALSGKPFTIDMEKLPSGIYVLDVCAAQERQGKNTSQHHRTYKIFRSLREDTFIGADVDFFVKKYDGGCLSVQLGTDTGEEWAVVDLYGDNGVHFSSEIVHLDKEARVLEYDWLDDYPDSMTMSIFSFRNGGSRMAQFNFKKPAKDSAQPYIEFVSSVDKAMPGALCRFGIRTMPDAECAVSVFDRSTEQIAENRWMPIYRRNMMKPFSLSVFSGGTMLKEEAIPFQLASTSSDAAGNVVLMRTKSAGSIPGAEMEYASDAVLDESRNLDVAIRDDFRNTIAFIPMLYSDREGNAEFEFRTSDKLSTYCVQVFAHNKDMDNAVLRKEMVVTMPLKVSIVPPQFLYGSDVYRLKASVSNSSSAAVSGTLTLYVYDTDRYTDAESVMVKDISLDIPAGGSSAGEFGIEVSVPADDRGVLGLKVVYRAEADGMAMYDGLFETVPVFAPLQTLTEAHSAVLLHGMDRDSLRRELEARFTGTLGQTYGYREISLRDMVLESIPDKVEPRSDNLLSVTEAYYSSMLAVFLRAASPDAEPAGEHIACRDSLVSRILAMQNADGGFAWFEGFRSSPVLTAVVLERIAMLETKLANYTYASRVAGKAAPGALPEGLQEYFAKAMDAAVGYLDNTMLQSSVMPLWYGGLSVDQYIYVRSMYPQVEFSPEADRKALDGFRKNVKSYMFPARQDWLDGYILGKARRIAAALNLYDDTSSSLASSWGLSRAKLAKSVVSGMASLYEYSVPHPSGGIYYPNAVMPFRGLLESELYAHSLICDLMAHYAEQSRLPSNKALTKGAAADADRALDIADGVRLWMMVQKETQEWGDDPAYINAVNSVLNGSDEVLAASIMVLEKKYIKPFNEVAAAGNGFTVVRTYYRENHVDEKDESGTGKVQRVEIKDGDVLCAGDKIVAEYKVWSAENRSFVLLSAPRCAALRPVQQLSGNTGGWARPVSLDGIRGLSVTPYAYREVKSDRTNWYMDVCPEEYVTFSEEFFVTQSGIFTAPAATIESMYAPHYRANDMFGGLMKVE
ncbi:MAG: MG2 domain-containing protein [Bacteroides sp.]|nr:MG2 domain-containing protein [Bacteroides sp.]